MRFSRSANSSSLAATTLPPRLRTARSGSRVKSSPMSGSSSGQQMSPRPLAGQLLATQPGAADDAEQPAPVVGGERILVVEALGVDHEGLVRGEDAEVGVMAQPDPALALEPQQPGRALGHPADDVGQGDAAPPRLGPDHRQAELQRGDAAPGQPEVADVQAL